jgi:hypothetical protein
MTRVWSYRLGLVIRMNRHVTWGDKRHWELTLGRTCVSRWCPRAPCHLAGVADQPHRISVRRWNRSGSAARR